jgi:hypothetical protein
LYCLCLLITFTYLHGFFSFYGFVFSKNWFDYYYVLINLMTAISWTLFKDECVFSLLHKWSIDPTYKMGDNPRSEDLLNLFGKKYYTTMLYVNKTFTFIKAWSTYVVLTRMGYPYSLFVSVMFLFYSLIKINYTLYRGFFFILFIFVIFNLKRTDYY